MIPRFVVFTAFLAATYAANTCLADTGNSSSPLFGPDCTTNATNDDGEDLELMGLCFRSQDGQAGCIPQVYYDSNLMLTSGCNSDACWCLEDDCNTESWFADFHASYVPPPQCFGGIAGSNGGPSCDENQVYKDNEYKMPDCYSRAYSSVCVENNEHMGMGDGCPEHHNATACENYRQGDRELEDSYDGTSKHCRWISAKDTQQKLDACQMDDGCKFYADRGTMLDDGSQEGSCDYSDIANAKWDKWEKEKGTMDCEERVKHGCFENNEWMGENEMCTMMESESTCHAVNSDCSIGFCSGEPDDNTTAACSMYNEEYQCMENSGCTYTKQCCRWVPTPPDMSEACATNGAGTLDVCSYNDGIGPPSKEIVQAGFEHNLFRLAPKFEGSCSMVASFRPGKGSASVLGADVNGFLQSSCAETSRWEDLAEHIGHTSETIREYCDNFIPDESVMQAFSTHSAGDIIAKAKCGQFTTIFPGLADKLFIIVEKAEFECLFTADHGVFGAAICTCNTAECNDMLALEHMVDLEVGPMRLMQFLDGTLLPYKDGLNAIVPDLLNEEGKINPNIAEQVTEANVDAIMLVEGMAILTNKEEVWELVQDYKKMNAAIRAGDCGGDGTSTGGDGTSTGGDGTSTGGDGTSTGGDGTSTGGDGGDGGESVLSPANTVSTAWAVGAVFAAALAF